MILLVFHSFVPSSSSPINHFDIAMEIFPRFEVDCAYYIFLFLGCFVFKDP